MACALEALSSVHDCVPNEGGIVKSYACKLADITTVTLTSGVVSNFTMASTGLWKKYEYDKDATANFNQVGALNGNRFTIEQTAFFKFKGIDANYIDAANNAKQCCDVVIIHFLANGTKLIQGLESQAATGAPTGTNNRSTRIVPTINTDTSANEARMEFTVAGNSNTFTLTTSLSDTAIEAL